MLEVEVDRPIEPHSGMAIDFGDLKRVVHDRVVDRLDHRYVNDIVDNPTAERMAVWIWRELEEALPGLAEVRLHETERCSVVYRGE